MYNEKELVQIVSKVAKVNTNTKTIVINANAVIGIKMYSKIEALCKYYNYTSTNDTEDTWAEVENNPNYNIKHNNKEKYTLTNKRK